MTKGFTFAQTPSIHFGTGKISSLPQLVKQYGNNVLIVTGASSFITSKYWPALQQSFADKDVNWKLYTIPGEPSPSMIDECVDKYGAARPDAVVAIGGGSVLDAGKAISAMLTINDTVRNYLEGIGTKNHSGDKVPFIAVPTTSGTGSEATKNAVLSEVGEAGFKKSLRHNNFVPNIAIADPELTFNCPPSITAASGMDAFTQLLESYLSTAANPMTDSLALEALRHLSASLVRAWEHGEDKEARTGMSYASLISGITLANAGLGTVHGFASSLGGYFDIPHGVICSALMAPSNKVTVRLLQKNGGSQYLQRYAEVGKIFSGKESMSQEYYIQSLLALIEEWTKKMGIPRLSSFGVSKADLNRILDATDNKNNPVQLNREELAEVLEGAM